MSERSSYVANWKFSLPEGATYSDSKLLLFGDRRDEEKRRLLLRQNIYLEKYWSSPSTPEQELKAIQEHISYLQRVIAPAAVTKYSTPVMKYSTYEAVLSGQSDLNQNRTLPIDFSRIARTNLSFRYPNEQRTCFNPMDWYTGFSKEEVERMTQAHPERWCKFYLSLDLNPDLREDPQGVEKYIQKRTHAEAFFVAVLRACQLRNIPLRSKTAEQDYASCKLYTPFPLQLQEILIELYQEFEKENQNDFWLGTYHILQKPVPGIPVEYVGAAQEPSMHSALGKKLHKHLQQKMGQVYAGRHSSRMGRIGRDLDLAITEGKIKKDLSDLHLKPEIYVEACAEARVYPAEPWRLNISTV